VIATRNSQKPYRLSDSWEEETRIGPKFTTSFDVMKAWPEFYEAKVRQVPPSKLVVLTFLFHHLARHTNVIQI